MSGYLAAGLVISLAALAVVGEFGRRQIVSSLLLLPGVVAGLLLSLPAKSFLERGHTRTAVLILSALASVSVILRQVL